MFHLYDEIKKKKENHYPSIHNLIPRTSIISNRILRQVKDPKGSKRNCGAPHPTLSTSNLDSNIFPRTTRINSWSHSIPNSDDCECLVNSPTLHILTATTGSRSTRSLSIPSRSLSITDNTKLTGSVVATTLISYPVQQFQRHRMPRLARPCPRLINIL